MLFEADFIRSRALVERVKKGGGDARRGAAASSIAPRARQFADMCTRSKMDIADVMAGLARRIAEILIPQDKDAGVKELLRMMSAPPTTPSSRPVSRVERHGASCSMFTRELCSWTHFSLAEILVLACTTGAGGRAPPASTRIYARMKCVQGHSSPVNVLSCRAWRSGEQAVHQLCAAECEEQQEGIRGMERAPACVHHQEGRGEPASAFEH